MAGDIEKDALSHRVATHMHQAEKSSRWFGIELDGAGAGWARAGMTVRDEMLNGHGTAHGGVIFTLADTAFAWACNGANQTSFAQHASITFLSMVRAGERLAAEAREESTAGRSGVYTVRVTAGDDRVVAIFQGLSRAKGGAVIEDADKQEQTHG